MGLLQAARFYVLYKDINKAKSFGLNRAIFYAWAKRYGGKRKISLFPRKISQKNKEKETRIFKLGDEEAFINKEGFFEIGNEIQRPFDYDKEIANKISIYIPYEIAWEKAINYVKKFSKKVLESQKDFYEKVYLPVRDSFLTEENKKGKSSLEKFF